MAIGERIHFFRLLRGMTQKYLGMALGFPEKSADVRLAQYEVSEMEGEVCLKVDVRKNKDAARLHEMLCSWQQATAMLEAGEISKENYDKWRYHYPEFDTTDHWHKVVPSQGLSDLLVSALKDNKESEEVKK